MNPVTSSLRISLQKSPRWKLWETEPAPAPMALVAFADPELKKNTFEITIPWLAGILSTRSLDKQIPGLNQIIAENKERITHGVVAVEALGTAS